MPSRLQSCWLCHFYHADGHPNAFCKFCSFHDSQMWSNRPHVACKNDGLKSSWSQEPKTKTDELIWIWTQEQIEARSLLPCGESLWNIEMTCQGMPHRNSDSGLSSSNTFANYVFGFFSLANCSILIYFASCQIRLIRRSAELLWTGILKSACWQGSVFDRPRLCHRGTWALQEKLQTFMST